MLADVTLPLLLLLLLPTAAPLAAARNNSLRSTTAERRRAPRTFITVSAQVSYEPMRTYVLLYEGVDVASGYWLCLWDRNPLSGNVKPRASVDLGSIGAGRSGWWNTGIPAEDSYSKKPRFEATELGRWAGLVPRAAGLVSTAAVGVSSMVTRPRWMQEHRAQLGPLPLTKLFLPGTHGSGAYWPFLAANPPSDWEYTVNQEESVLWQLVFGIRYLDLRVAYYWYSPRKWWVNHGPVAFWPLEDVLEEVLTFMRATEEVVVLDFHGFPTGWVRQGRQLRGWYDDLVAFLRKRLGAVAAPAKAGWAATLDQLVAGGRRLVVSFNEADAVAENADFLWPAVSHKWGNVRTLEDLHDYLRRFYLRPPEGPWAAMAELTANTGDVILNRLGGLRWMADSVNKNVTAWYRGEWGKTVNVVAVDFFRGTAIVEAAIDWNLQRAAEARARKAAGNDSQQARAEPKLSTPRGPL